MNHTHLFPVTMRFSANQNIIFGYGTFQQNAACVFKHVELTHKKLIIKHTLIVDYLFIRKPDVSRRIINKI
jgi:hypothetical protein